MFRKFCFSTLLIAGVLISLDAQNYTYSEEKACLVDIHGDCIPNPILSAVPFLGIIPDARSKALGWAGVALSPDANSINNNISKLAFSDQRLAFAANLDSWDLFDDHKISLFYLASYYYWDDQAISIDFRRFYYPTSISWPNGFLPIEYSFSGAYAKKLSPHLSLGLGGRYIFSHLSKGTVSGIEITAARAFAVDISSYYNKKVTLLNLDSELSVGLSIKNLGSKISYSNSINKDFIPGNFTIGSSLKMNFNQNNNLTFTLDINKQLLPTPDTTGIKFDGSVIEAAIVSWYDAPGGMREELREYFISLGIEYWFYEMLALRGGYYYEHPLKGNRQYMTFGIGAKYRFSQFDFAYNRRYTFKEKTSFSPYYVFTLMINLQNSKNK